MRNSQVADRFVAISNELMVVFERSPRLPDVATHLHALGFDTTSVREMGAGVTFLRFGRGPDRGFLDAVDSLARGPHVLRVDNDLLSMQTDLLAP